MQLPRPRLQTVLYASFAAALLGSAVFVALPFAEASTSATGNNNSVTITLNAVIRPTCTIAAVADPQATNIDLSTTQSNLAIATITETCNNNGYTVTVSSQNGANKGQPEMVGTVLNGAMNYSVSYGGTPVTFSGGQATALDISSRQPTTRRPVAISFTGNPGLASDSYTDILTFSIVGK